MQKPCLPQVQLAQEAAGLWNSDHDDQLTHNWTSAEFQSVQTQTNDFHLPRVNPGKIRSHGQKIKVKGHNIYIPPVMGKPEHH